MKSALVFLKSLSFNHNLFWFGIQTFWNFQQMFVGLLGMGLEEL